MCISRLETINKLKNKHGKSIEELIQYKKQLDEKLSSIQSADNIKETLEKKLAKHRKALISACENLSLIRKEAAKQLEEKITAELKELNFNDAKFSIQFKKADAFTSNGSDIAEFMISTNKGCLLYTSRCV